MKIKLLKYIPLFLLCTQATFADSRATEDTGWTRSNANYSSNKFSPNTAINVSNVNQLVPAWEWDAGGDIVPSDTVQVNPIFVDGSIFTTTLSGFLVSINAIDGKENWRTQLPAPVGRRGLTFSEVNLKNVGVLKIIFTPTSRGIYAIDAKSGKIQTQIGTNGIYGDNWSVIAPVVTEDTVLTATMLSTVESFDLITGKKKWTKPLSKDGNYRAAVWSGMSYDASRSTIYVTTGNPGEVVGVNRPGDNLYSNSLVAIDAKSGEVNWYTQEVSHDLWDLDMVGAPILSALEIESKKVDVVIGLSKSGNTLVVNRDTGKFLFENSYRSVPESTLAGEMAAKKQLHVDWPQSFSSIDFKPEMITDISETDHDYVQFKLRNAKFNSFLPPSLDYPVALFGLHGGAEWPGGAFDPNNKILVVPSNKIPWILRLEYREIHRYENLDAIKNNALYQEKCASCHGKFREGNKGYYYRNDIYYPSLVGVTLKNKNQISDIQKFHADHKYAENYTKTITKKELALLAKYLNNLDSISKNNLRITGFWQMVLDTAGRPGSKPPYGNLTALNLESGKVLWSIPFGQYDELINGKKVKGQQNFGGSTITGSGLIFATGTVDNKIRAFDERNGAELWSYKMPAAGSAPPSTFMLNGEQYVIVNCTGGRYLDFSANKNKLIAFKLKKSAN